MHKILIITFVLFIVSCTAQQKTTTTYSGKGGDTRTVEVKYLDENTYLLTELSLDATYGYTEGNPIMVGGVHDGSAVLNERRFLNALLGPNGEAITYHRAGSCCGFETPNGFINNMGMLDIYIIEYPGAAQSIKLYINMYDAGDLKIPIGFTAKTN